ncbi:MAG: SpoIIE family protein phosphatase [Bacteroidales bacterium]|nr:SpoIIE family protein phosphatase [Bacteroidales bacterium]
MKFTKYILSVILIVAAISSYGISAYESQLDSLDRKLQQNYEKGAPSADNFALLRKIYNLVKIAEPQLALEYACQAQQLAISEDQLDAQAEWQEAIADIHFKQRVYFMAMDEYFSAYCLYKSLESSVRMGYTLLKYGDTYFIQNMEEIAKKNYQKADSIFTQYQCQEGRSEALNRLGRTELANYQYETAIEYFNQSLAIAQSINNPELAALAYCYMAEAYDQTEDYENEDKYLNLAVTKYRLSGESFERGNTFFQMGEMCLKNEAYDQALTNYMRAFNIFNTFGPIRQVASAINRLGRVSYLQGDFMNACTQGKKALSMALEHNDWQPLNYDWQEERIEALKLLADINSRLGRTDSAYIFLGQYAQACDSLFEAKKQASNTEMQVSKSTQAKEQELAMAEVTIQKKQTLNNIIACFSAIVVVFLIYVFINARKQKRVNELLQKTNEEINTKNEKITLQNEEITRQKELVESVNAEIRLRNDEIEAFNETITSSINYAGRIQHAMLPGEDFIKKHFVDGFIYFHPKEVVSGDFYWFSEVKQQKPSLFRRKDDDGKLIMAVIDCTGHGVPGAFMSMLGDAFLNQIVNLQNITQPSLILQELHKLVRTTLQQETTENNDGMDAAIVTIDKQNHVMEFAGAKNPLIYIQNGTVEKVNGDIKSIGGMQKEDERTFTNHLIDITLPTKFYIYSDGYQDQFGGENKRKLMAKRFRDVLTEKHELPFAQQNDELFNFMKNWRGKFDQMDDTTILGVQIN